MSLVVLVLQGCGSVATKPQTAGAAVKEEPVVQQNPIEVAMLKRAEQAFRKGDLTKPNYANAYDLFHSVLIINPENQQARSGLQAILIRYAEMIREATRKNQFSKSQRLLSQVEKYYPANDLLMELKKEAKKRKAAYMARQKPVPAEKPGDRNVSEFVLPTYALSKRTAELTRYIGEVAVRLKSSQEYVMIYARTDAEGRWIYSQLKKAVPGYRVRGDIKLGRKPRLVLLPPLQ